MGDPYIGKMPAINTSSASYCLVYVRLARNVRRVIRQRYSRDVNLFAMWVGYERNLRQRCASAEAS